MLWSTKMVSEICVSTKLSYLSRHDFGIFHKDKYLKWKGKYKIYSQWSRKNENENKRVLYTPQFAQFRKNYYCKSSFLKTFCLLVLYFSLESLFMFSLLFFTSDSTIFDYHIVLDSYIYLCFINIDTSWFS